MKNKIIGDSFKRKLVLKYELKRLILKLIQSNNNIPFRYRFKVQHRLQKLPRNSNFVRINNRCVFTGRQYGVLRRFKLSRIQIKKYEQKGFLPGLLKSSW